MSKILSLSKVLFVEQFKTLFSKVSPGKKVKSIFLFVFLSALILFSIGSNYFTQHMVLNNSGMGHMVLFYGIINVVMILLILFTLQIQNVFFEAKDFEFLASLPLKNYQIIAGKLISQLANAYLISAFLFIPSLPFYFISAGFNLVSAMYLLVGFAFLPFFNFFIATLLSFFVNMIAKFSSNPKKVANILSYTFMVALAVGMGIINFVVLGDIAVTGQIPNVLKFLLPTTVSFFDAVVNLNALSFLFYVLVSVVLMALVVVMLSKTYFKVNKNKKSPVKKVKGSVSYKKQPVLKNMIWFEFKRFLSIPIYVFNTSIGAILMILASLALPFLYFFIFKTHPVFEFVMSQKDLVFIIGLVVALFASVNCTTYASVSIEGKMHPFKKSLPISFEKNMLAKIAVNMILFIPTLIFLAVLTPFFVMAGLLFYEIILIYFVSFFAQLFVALSGLFANLLFINLNWTNPTLLVKQSVPAFIYAFILVAIMVGSFAIFQFSITFMPQNLFVLLLILAFVLLSALMWLLIVTVGKKKYNKVG